MVDEFQFCPGPEKLVVLTTRHAEFEDGIVAESAQAGQRSAEVSFLVPGVD